MAMIDPRALLTLALLARRCLTQLADDGFPVPPEVHALVDDVERHARGDKVTKAALKAHAAAMVPLGEMRGKDGIARGFAWTASALQWLAAIARSGVDNRDEVIQHLRNGQDWGANLAERNAREQRVVGWLAEATATAASSTASTTAQAAPKVPAKTAAREAEAIAKMAAALGAKAGKQLATRGARFDPKQAGDPVKLAALLKRHGYPAHPSVFAFDAVFGGLLIPDEGAAEDWRESGEATLVGAYACLKSDAHVRPTGGRDDLVPIAYTSNDGIAYLDANGVAFYEDTIADDAPKKLAADGPKAVAKLLR